MAPSIDELSPFAPLMANLSRTCMYSLACPLQCDQKILRCWKSSLVLIKREGKQPSDLFSKNISCLVIDVCRFHGRSLLPGLRKLFKTSTFRKRRRRAMRPGNHKPSTNPGRRMTFMSPCAQSGLQIEGNTTEAQNHQARKQGSRPRVFTRSMDTGCMPRDWATRQGWTGAGN